MGTWTSIPVPTWYRHDLDWIRHGCCQQVKSDKTLAYDFSSTSAINIDRKNYIFYLLKNIATGCVTTNHNHQWLSNAWIPFLLIKANLPPTRTRDKLPFCISRFRKLTQFQNLHLYPPERLIDCEIPERWE